MQLQGAGNLLDVVLDGGKGVLCPGGILIPLRYQRLQIGLERAELGQRFTDLPMNNSQRVMRG